MKELLFIAGIVGAAIFIFLRDMWLDSDNDEPPMPK